MSATTLPQKLVELNRTAARCAAESVSGAARTVMASAGRVFGASRTAGRTVAGQTQAAADRTATTARRGAAEVTGQAEAQGGAVAEVVEHEANRVMDRAIGAVDDRPGSGVPYEDWTREQLYHRAQELDVPGRSGMSKAELIRALRA